MAALQAGLGVSARATLLAALAVSLAACAGQRVRPIGPTIAQLGAQPSVPVRTGALPSPQPSEAMANYRQFLQLQNADPSLRAEALRRLGDLNLEAGMMQRMANEVTQLDAPGAEAIGLYTTLLKAYPDYPRNDQVLYQLARAYDTTGQTALALSTLDEIVARYPHDSDLGEVQFRRGELLFSAQRYPEAQQAYRAVLALGPAGSRFYPQSLYKHAWSQFKQGQNQQALSSFADLLDYTLIDPANGERMRRIEQLARADQALVDDTLRAMSISFSYLDGPKSVDELAGSRAHMPYAWLLYQRLGDLYVQKQRYQDAAATDRAFVARNPADEHAPTLSMAAIEAYRKGGFPDLMLQGKLEYVQRYDFSAPFWNGRAHADYAQVVDELRTNLKDVAQYYHALAQKTKSDADYASAAHWYRAYLGSFPNEQDSAATNYLLADALFESKQFLPAATEYEHTAYGYAPHPQAPAAGYAALVAYQQYESTLPPAGRAAVHLRAIDSGLKFARAFPNHPEAATVFTHAAQDLYAAGDQVRAAQAARLLLARSAGVERAQQRIGWTIIGQVGFNQGDFPGAETAFTHALALAAANDPERSDITERLAAAIYQQGDSKRKAGDQAGAAEDFLRVTRAAPASKIAQTAQYDAAAALIEAQQWPRAIQVLQDYRRAYPHGQYSAGVNSKLAVAYAATGQAGAAAAEFERIASDPSEDPATVHDALTQAADLYQKSGNSTRAVVMLERLVQQYPTPVPDAIEVRSRLADIATQGGDLQRARYWQRQIVLADAAAGSARTDRTRYLAAQAQLALAAPIRDAFRDIKLVAPLKRTLAAKTRALEAAVQAYKEVAAYQVAQTTTAATYESAELYHTLAQDLLSSARPKGLSADELEQYESLLEDQAYPFEQQAIAIHELNARRMQQGIYDDSVRKSMAALAELMPARYGKTERSETWVAALTVPVSVTHAASAAAATAAAAGAQAQPGADSSKSKAKSAKAKRKAAGGEHPSSSAQAATAVAGPSATASAAVAAPPVPPPGAAALADFQHATDLANAGRDTDAQLELGQFELRYPGYAIPAVDLGLLARRAGKLDVSETALQQATQLDADSAVAWDELGVTLRQEGKFTQARAAYARALSADPNYAPAHRNLGVLLDLYLGDAAAALPQFERYKALTGEDKPVSVWIADLRQRTGIKAPPAAAPGSPAAGAPNPSANVPAGKPAAGKANAT
ncbi:MAG TPA: tetratricopeptide repeat protein [Steroidobacteraceae bacterium]|jgi:tetratricopeptide (TPR) repeat protein|nr:tetratricopeptide repeat protein [Steroidobacteraceae bacterium]